MAVRNEEGNFSAKQVLEKAGLSIADVSVRTVNKVIKQRRLFLFTSAEKGTSTKG